MLGPSVFALTILALYLLISRKNDKSRIKKLEDEAKDSKAEIKELRKKLMKEYSK